MNTTSGIQAEDWGALETRVELYLKACRVREPALLRELAARVIATAREHHRQVPERDGVELVGEEIRALVAAWAAHPIRAAEAESPEQRFAHIRAANLMVDDGRDAFLDAKAMASDFGVQFESTYVQAGPELNFSNMAPRPIDLGPVSSLAGGAWRTFDKWPILRGVAIWVLCFAVLVAAFLAIRY